MDLIELLLQEERLPVIGWKMYLKHDQQLNQIH
jgi:hypothetical protein